MLYSVWVCSWINPQTLGTTELKQEIGNGKDKERALGWRAVCAELGATKDVSINDIFLYNNQKWYTSRVKPIG